MSSSSRAFMLMACLMGVWSLLACGFYGEDQMYPTPSYQESLPGYGESCWSRQCQSGLFCTLGVCQWITCSQAPDPNTYCAEQLDVDTAQCVESECISSSSSPFNKPCNVGTDACGMNGVCIEGRCRESCDEVGQACDGGFECVQKNAQRFCDANLPCNQQDEPDLWCEQVSGIPQYQVSCVSGRCVQMKQPPGGPCDSADDCRSDLTCYQGACYDECQNDTQCDDGEVCVKPGNACLPSSFPPCHLSEIPSVSCSIAKGYALELAHCDEVGACSELEPVQWPVLLIKDTSTDPGACVRRTFSQRFPGATPTSVFVTSLMDMGDVHTSIHVLRAEIVQQDPSFATNNKYFEPQGRTGIESLADTICKDEGFQSNYFANYPSLSLGCEGKLYMRVMNRSSFRGMISLGGNTDVLNIGWLRSSCEGFVPGYPEPQAEVYRCRTEVFEVGDEQACELLVELPSMGSLTSQYALP